MVKLVSLAAILTVVLFLLAVPALAKEAKDDKDKDEDNSDDGFGAAAVSNIIITSSEKQFPARVGAIVNWARKGNIQNTGTTGLWGELKFHSKSKLAKVIIGTTYDEGTRTIVDGVEYNKSVKNVVTISNSKHIVKIKVPAGGTLFFEVHYSMPAPTMTSSVLQSTATNFLSQFTASTSYDQHTNNVVAPMAVSELPADWAYSAFSTGADGSKRQLRYYLKDSDGSGALDEIGVVVPQLSTVNGELEGQLLPSPSKLSNYQFQQVRADQPDLPFGWVLRQTLDLTVEDEYPGGDPTYFQRIFDTTWPYNPFSDEGYDDNSSLIVRNVGLWPIFAPPVNAATSFNLNFKYKPGFASSCGWQNGIEIMFPAGPLFSDTTYLFYLWDNGSVTSDDMTVSSVPDVNGWHDVNIARTLDSPVGEGRVVRFFTTLASGCADTPNKIGEFQIDNAILTAV